MMTTAVTPAAGVDHAVACALVDTLGLLRPVAHPRANKIWQLADDQCLTTMLTVLKVRGCVFPGCHREPRDCDAHHINPGPPAVPRATTAQGWCAPRITG